MTRRASSIVIGAMLALSAGVHAYVIDAHLKEWWLSGAFFVAAAAIQALCAYLVVTARDRRAAAAGAATSVLLIATWATSRTLGIPFGPHAGIPETVGGADLLSTAAEAITVVAFVVSLKARHDAIPALSRLWRAAAVMAVALTFGVGTAAASAMPHHGHETAHSTVSDHRSAEHDVADRREPTDVLTHKEPRAEPQSHVHGHQDAPHEHPSR